MAKGAQKSQNKDAAKKPESKSAPAPAAKAPEKVPEAKVAVTNGAQELKPAAPAPSAKIVEAKPAEAKAAETKPEPEKGPEAPRSDERWDLTGGEISYRIGEVARQGRLRDVSDSGCRIEHVNDQPRIGALVELEVPGKLGPIGRVRVRGNVRWIKPGYDDRKLFGVSFAKGQGEAVRKLLYRALVND